MPDNALMEPRTASYQHEIGRDVNALIGDDTGYFPKQELRNVDPYWQQRVGSLWQKALEGVGAVPSDKRLSPEQHRLVHGLTGSGEIGNANAYGATGWLSTLLAPQATYGRSVLAAGAPHLASGIEAIGYGNPTNAIAHGLAATIPALINRGLPHSKAAMSKKAMRGTDDFHDNLASIAKIQQRNADRADEVVSQIAHKMAPIKGMDGPLRSMARSRPANISASQRIDLERLLQREAAAARSPWGHPYGR